MAEAVAVANTFLDLARAANKPLTHIKLQKLVYYAHGWHLAIRDTALVDEGVEAWRWGPVVKPLYHAFKDFEGDEITHKAQSGRYSDGEADVSEPVLPEASMEHAVIAKVMEVYGDYTAIQLSNATHADGTPWHTVASKFLAQGWLPANLRIPDGVIKEHFKAQMN